MRAVITGYETFNFGERRRDLAIQRVHWKLGPLAPELTQRVAALASDTLLKLDKSISSFHTIDDLQHWLDRHAN